MGSFSRDQMRELDRKTIEEIGILGTILMENAGRGAALYFREIMLKNASDDLIDLHNSLTGKRILVVNGKGNNGGDGFVIARHMHNWGAKVKIILLGKNTELQGDALINYKIIKAMKLEIIEDFQEEQIESVDFEIYDAIIDGIFGTGLARGIQGRANTVIRYINTRKTGFVFAIDVPSGLDVDTGFTLGVCVKADATATFGGMKKGMLIDDAASLCGKIKVIDISVPRELYE